MQANKKEQSKKSRSSAVGGAQSNNDDGGETVFWNNFEAAEHILQKMFPNQSWEFRVTVPGKVREGYLQVATLCYGLGEEKETLR